jgi:hypothetical protein
VWGALIVAWALHAALCDRTRVQGSWADDRTAIKALDWHCCPLPVDDSVEWSGMLHPAVVTR